MKVPLIVQILLAGLLVRGQVIDLSKKMICSENNPSDCYPQVFEPTKDWQVVKEGQQIPAGLHVRVNLETGLEEARILQEDINLRAEVVIADVEDVQDKVKVGLNSEEVKKKMQDTINQYRERKKTFSRNKITVLDLNDFDHSVTEVVSYQAGDSTYRLEKALSTLADLSHDIEFGERLAQDPVIFYTMADLANNLLGSKEKVLNPTNVRLSELIYRLMGSALRNNPEAVEKVLENQPTSFVDGLFAALSNAFVSEVIHKRILGVVHALTANRHFSYRYFNKEVTENAVGLHQLISLFPSLGVSSQVRIANIFEDLHLLPQSNKESEINESNVGETLSSYLQSTLAEQILASEEQAQIFFKALLELHGKNNYPVSKDFLQWLSKESEQRRASLRQRDDQVSEDSFDNLILSARHKIFGNPLARKDEL